MINSGYIQATFDPDPVTGAPQLSFTVYYDSTAPVGPTQPLINGPRGYCLDIVNTTAGTPTVTMSGPNGTMTGAISAGDPVTAGQVKSQTAAQMARLGYSTRGDVTSVSLSAS